MRNCWFQEQNHGKARELLALGWLDGGNWMLPSPSIFVLISAYLWKFAVPSFRLGRAHDLLVALNFCPYSFWWKETCYLWFGIDSECSVQEKLPLARFRSCSYTWTPLCLQGERYLDCLRDMIMPVVKEVKVYCQVGKREMQAILNRHKRHCRVNGIWWLIDYAGRAGMSQVWHLDFQHPGRMLGLCS